jgi:ectoine hydroxylase-related dioxygenase (phytanoyl-CoA dioxygenase family)
MTILDADQIRSYREEGYVVLDGIVPPATIAMLREECRYFVGYTDGAMDARDESHHDITHRGRRYFIGNDYRRSDRVWRFLFSDYMATLVEQMVGPEAYLFNEQWVVKAPEVGMNFAWHQDSGYIRYHWPESPHRPYLSCWCPLEDVNEDNGTIYVLPHCRAGTRDRVHDHVEDGGTHDLVGYTGTDPGIPIECSAGSVVAFSSLTMHRSGANRSAEHRQIYLAQYSAERILNPEGDLWSQAVPFLHGGRNIYDRGTDAAERWGPKRRR